MFLCSNLYLQLPLPLFPLISFEQALLSASLTLLSCPQLKDLHSQGYSLLSIDSHGQTALHFGARHGFKDIVRYLIASAPACILDMVDNERGQTALHQAAQNRRRTVCCMLVAAGASLTISDLQGNNPRALAQHADDQELAAYLESQEQFQTMVHEDLETTV
ncbi:Eye-specific diacylglycerol kinase [Chionoecetes opilio]|uniref:Eye-specific diacylglycerol kinase n=1 Tax=Chionoecetes opilio TaxID=41210 RepID=A0A8J5CQH7_CHIOP|nr:Eye-specific diacylglycerol kinase [Chionoecetes opilio]